MNKLSGIIKNLKKGGGIKIVIFLGILGMILILCSELFEGDKKTEKQSENLKASESYETYGKDIENRLKEMVEKIEGVGKAEVMVTIKGTEEYVYAQQEKVKNGEKDFSSENEYVIIGSNGEKQALLKKVINPEISGVAIICEGGDSNIVKERIYNAVSAMFDLSSQKIYVTKLK